MKVIDYIELLSYGKYDYYDTKFSINNTGIKGNFTMNYFCQRLALTEEVLNMEIEIIEDTPKEDKKIEHIKFQNNLLHNDLNIIEKLNEIIDKVNGGK